MGTKSSFSFSKREGTSHPQPHAAGTAVAHRGSYRPALDRDEGWWFLVNEQQALTFARQQGIKAFTVLEFIVYLYEVQILSLRSTLTMEVRQVAARAHLSVAAFLEALAARTVAILEYPDAFGPGLEALQEAFGREPV
jgi:hypothetical protein